MTIFRKEVLARRKPELLGEVSLALPMSWHIISALVFFIVIIGITALFSLPYTKHQNFRGQVKLAGGIAEISPSSVVRITDIYVSTGEAVSAGTPILRVANDSAPASDPYNGDQILGAIEDQQFTLVLEKNEIESKHKSDRNQIATSIEFLNLELVSLESQIQAQKQLVQTAASDLEQAKEVAKRGFVSQRDLSIRKEVVVQREQRLASLEQAKLAKTSELQQQRSALFSLDSSARSLSAQISNRLARLDGEKVGEFAGLAFDLSSPVKGTVGAILVAEGALSQPGDQLVLIEPDNGRLLIEIPISGAAVDFLTPGEEISVSLGTGSFTAQRDVPAQILSVSAVPLDDRGADDGDLPLYLLTARPLAEKFAVQSREIDLRPGLGASFSLELDRKPLFNWLLDPLLSRL